MRRSTHPLIDIGVNLSSSRLYTRYEEILSRALESGVGGLILTGTDLESSALLARFCSEPRLNSPQLWSTAGVHPHDSAKVEAQDKDWRETLSVLLQNDRVISVGECGLDFERDYSPRDIQRQVFESQLELAVEFQKPLFLHQRGAGETFLDLLREYAPQLPKRIDDTGEHTIAAVVHCYTEGPKLMESLLELGCYIGITGWICDERRADSLRSAVTSLPLQRVLIETDAPYLLPRTLRPKPKKGFNEPCYLPHIVEHISMYLGEPVDVLERASRENTERLFSISLNRSDATQIDT